jgi:hypothetical protein
MEVWSELGIQIRLLQHNIIPKNKTETSVKKKKVCLFWIGSIPVRPVWNWLLYLLCPFWIGSVLTLLPL